MMLWLVLVGLPAAAAEGPVDTSRRRGLQSSGSIRLVDGSNNFQGRVEIYYNGQWGTVCDDYWDLSDAKVVCQQLFGMDALEAPCCAYFGQGSGDIWMDNVHCSGTEAALSDCSFNGWGYEDCSHSEDASVVCEQSSAATATPAPTPDGCALYVVGPVVASQSNQVATVDSLQNYELTFTMELASDWSVTGEWQSVLHIGDSNSQRLPGIWFHPSSNGLHVKQTPQGSWGWGVSSTTGVTFAAGETCEIKVVVQSNQMTVYVDGVAVGTALGSATETVANAAVYVGDPWSNAASVTLSHICFREVPGLPSPAPTITRAPTVTPIPTADICGGGPGTSTYDGRTLRCIQLSDGEVVDVLEVDGIVQTCRHHDDNSCPAGFDIWVPRSYEHAEAVVNAVDVEFTYLVGVYRNEDGPNGWPNEGYEEDCGGCTDVAMNSDTYADWVAQGTNRVPWTSVAGSPWFLRSTTYSEPNGNYELGCWLTTNWEDGWVDGEGFSVDDGGCGYCFTKYLCSTNTYLMPTRRPTYAPTPRRAPRGRRKGLNVVALVASLCVVGAFLVVCGIIYVKKYYSSKNMKVAAVPNNAATDDGDTITVEAPPGKLGLKFEGTSTIVKEVFSDSPLVGKVYPGDALKNVNGVAVTAANA